MLGNICILPTKSGYTYHLDFTLRSWTEDADCSYIHVPCSRTKYSFD